MIREGIKEYVDIRKNLHALLEGVVLCIDPSCGSKGENGSLPGWAISFKGELVASGTIDLPVEEDLWIRLQSLHHGLRKLVKTYNPDILIYENIAPRRYGGGSAHSHASLLKAVGVTLSVSGPTAVIGLRPTIWTKFKRSTYIKSDEADAIEILWVAIETAREIELSDPPRGYGGTGASNKKASRVKKAATIVEGTGASGTGTTKQTRRGRKASGGKRKTTGPSLPPF